MTTVVIPTRNEPKIGEIVQSIVLVGWDVIVADHSDDAKTAGLAAAAGAKVVFPGPGLGPAYLAAWDKIDPDDLVIHYDAGGSWDLDDLFDLSFGMKGYDLIIGSRLCPSGEHRGPWKRRKLSEAAAFISNQLRWGRAVQDWTSGFRYYSPLARQFIRAHDFRATGHAWQIESLAVCLNAGLKVVEVPVVYEPSSSQLDFGRMREALGVWRWMAFQ